MMKLMMKRLVMMAMVMMIVRVTNTEPGSFDRLVWNINGTDG